MAFDSSFSKNLRALVDMGSNGIRFSISDLSPATARIMPTVFQDRAAISLYDAQYSSGTKAAIPPDIIAHVLVALKRFQRTCEDFNVSRDNIRVLATEATREAINSVEFRNQIKTHTGWEVELLRKEEEGRIGAMGVASSFRSINGLVMDLGGGSVQLSWMSEKDGQVTLGKDGVVVLGKGSISLPYGAAALLNRLQGAEGQGRAAVDALRQEVQGRLLAAFYAVAPSTYSQRNETKGFPLFLSGGGFRGWGYILMDRHAINPYPIPIINGFAVRPSDFTNSSAIRSYASTSPDIFRVSEHRASQIPAVALLVGALTAALPIITSVRFCQGGVREGALFDSLSCELRARAPLSTATAPYSPLDSAQLLSLLVAAVPLPPNAPQLVVNLLEPFIHLLYFHFTLPKEGRPAAALRCTTTGLLAGVHGLLHEERAALALMLCERWGGPGELSPTDEGFFVRMQLVVDPEVAWWVTYVGRVGGLVGEVYPAGVVPAERVGLKVEVWRLGLRLLVRVGNAEDVEKAVKRVMKCGKKKNWIGGREGWGMKVEVDVVAA